MRERSLKRRTAFILAVLLTFMNCFPSYASETVDDIGDPEIAEELNITEDTVENEDIVTSDVVDFSNASDNEAEDLDVVSNDSVTANSESQKDEDVISNEGIDKTEDSVSVKSRLLTSKTLQLGSSGIKLLGANSDEPGLNNGWSEKYGILWQLSGNKLKISENKTIENTSIRGYMGDSGFKWTPNEEGTQGTGEGFWLPYASQIEEVWFDPDSTIKNISPYAFAGTNITGIDIPITVESIGVGAFVDCKKISVIGVKNNPHFYSNTDAGSNGDGILYQVNDDGTTSLLFCPVNTYKKVTVSPETVTVCDYSFYGCSYLPNVEIPEKVSTIGTGAFMGCSSLETVNIGKRKYADSGSEDFTGNNLSSIGEKAFKMCAKLKFFYLPDKLTSIGKDAFANDSNLSYVIVYGTVNGNDDDLNRASAALVNAINNANTSKKSESSYVKEVLVPYNHCILFFDNGSYTYDPLTFEYGKIIDQSKFPMPKYPSATAQNWKFNGWFFGNTQYDDGMEHTLIGDIISLKAKWIEYYWITFNPNGGTLDGSDDNDSVSCDSGSGLKSGVKPSGDWPVKPEKDGRGDIFVGWYDSVSKRTFVYENEANIRKVDKTYATNPVSIYSDTSSYFVSSRELKAVYKESVTVRFYSPKGETIAEYKKYVGDYLSSDAIADLRNSELLYDYENDISYKWVGWRTAAGASLNTNNSLTSDDDGRIYYAIYDRYATVYYWNMDNQNGSTYSLSVNIPVNSTYVIERQPDISGYKRMGWYSKPGGGGTKYGTKLNITKNQLEYNLYAHYLKYYKVTTNDQKSEIGGTDSETVHLDVVSGSSIYSLGVVPHDDIHVGDDESHYAFAGWYTEKKGNGILIDESYKISSDNLYVYAYWNQGYLVSYYVDGAGASYTMPYVAEYGTNLIIPESPTQEWADNHGYMGYDFKGWYTEPDGQGVMVTQTTKVTSDMNLYGYWVDNPDRENWPMYIVSFNSMGGSEVSYQRVSVNSLLSMPDEPVWADHKFIGWYKDKDFKEEWDFFNDTVTEDGWLYAKWITWTEEDEDNAHGIYWVRMLRGGKAPLTEYFKESGLKFSYDKNIVKVQKKGQIVKGKKAGETLITAYKVDGSEYPVKVRVFVLKQELQDMYVFNTSTTLNAPDFLTVSGFLPDRWESSKTSVASIDPKTGLITVRGRGRSKIKAYYQNRSVTATLYSEVPKFAKQFYIFKTGQRKKIKIKKVKKYDIVSWNIIPTTDDYYTDNSGISRNSAGYAEVDNNGVVTAVSAGEVMLQASVYGQTITTKLHIEPPTLKTRQLQININKTKRLKLSRTKLKYVEWQSSNENIAYVDPTNGKVYALKTGRVTLRTTAGGVTNTCNVVVEDPESYKTGLGYANSTLK